MELDRLQIQQKDLQATTASGSLTIRDNRQQIVKRIDQDRELRLFLDPHQVEPRSSLSRAPAFVPFRVITSRKIIIDTISRNFRLKFRDLGAVLLTSNYFRNWSSQCHCNDYSSPVLEFQKSFKPITVFLKKCNHF